MTNVLFDLIPHPKLIECKGSAVDFGNRLTFRCTAPKSLSRQVTAASKRCFEELAATLTTRPWTGKSGGKSGIFIHITEAGSDPRAGSDPDWKSLPPEGYVLEIENGSIRAAATSVQGILYALQTLSQLANRRRSGFRAPEVSIRDWPTLEVRGAHLDLHNLTLTQDALEERLALFAGYKLNTVLISYADKFRFRGHPSASHKGALTRSEVRRLDRLAGELGIDLIPVIQCLGHSANVLKRTKYRHLREREDVLTQFCPCNPDSLALVKEMLDDIIETHSSKYVHIGADETYFLGDCPRCRNVTDKKGKIGLYNDYVSKVCDHVKSRGRTPVLWDDMICTSPVRAGRLARKADLCYWDYFPADSHNPFVFFRNHGWFCNKAHWKGRPWWGGDFVDNHRCRDITEMPGDWREHYDAYFSVDPEFRWFHAFPFFRFYKDAGYRVFGCAAARGGEYAIHCPNYIRRMSNIRQMTRVVAENHGDGVITTSWSEMMSPEELTTYLFAAAAEEAWSPGAMVPEEFSERFVRQFFGTDSPDISAAMARTGRHATPLGYTSEDRTDICERGSEADRETLPELLGRRIEAFLKKQTPGEAIEELSSIAADASAARNLLTKARKSVTRNLHTFNHLVLAAATLEHKAQRAILICRAEEALTIRGQGCGKLVEKLSVCARETAGLRNRIRRLFEKSYRSYSVDQRDAILFEGEVEKIEAYRKRLLE